MRVIELVPKRPKGVVCKTTSRGFESHPVLLYMWTLAERFNALDCGSRVHQFESGTPTFMVPWCNGSTSDFLSENEGSTPSGTDFWRDGREAECGSMLSCYSGNAIGGSNPSLSVLWFVRLTVRTAGFHPANRSSTLLRTFFGKL